MHRALLLSICTHGHILTHTYSLPSSQVTLTLGSLIVAHYSRAATFQRDPALHLLTPQTLRFWGARVTKHFDLVLVSFAEIRSPKARSFKTNSPKTCVFKVRTTAKSSNPFWVFLGFFFSHLGVLFFFVMLWVFQGFISIHLRILLSYQQHKFIKFAALCK